MTDLRHSVYYEDVARYHARTNAIRRAYLGHRIDTPTYVREMCFARLTVGYFGDMPR